MAHQNFSEKSTGRKRSAEDDIDESHALSKKPNPPTTTPSDRKPYSPLYDLEDSRLVALPQELFEMVATELCPKDILILRAAYPALAPRIDESPGIRSALWLPAVDESGQAELPPNPKGTADVPRKEDIFLGVDFIELDDIKGPSGPPSWLPGMNPILAEAFKGSYNFHEDDELLRLLRVQWGIDITTSETQLRVVDVYISAVRLLKAVKEIDGMGGKNILHQMLLFKSTAHNERLQITVSCCWEMEAGKAKTSLMESYLGRLYRVICGMRIDSRGATMGDLVEKLCKVVPDWKERISDEKME